MRGAEHMHKNIELSIACMVMGTCCLSQKEYQVRRSVPSNFRVLV